MSGTPSAHGDAQRHRVLSFLCRYSGTHGYQPTIAEISRALEIHRTSVIWHLSALRNEGLVHYVDGNVARSLKVLEPK